MAGATITVQIPLTTLTPNQVINVPASQVPVGITLAALSVNRNVGGFSLDATPSAQIVIWQDWSPDNGTTWNPGMPAGQHFSTSTIVGGVINIPQKGGGSVRIEASGEEVSIPGDPTSTTRMVRAGVDNGSSQVSVSGTVTLS